MTREEAIKRIETHIEYHKCGAWPFTKTDEALEMAIAALREQAERSKGCKYCNGLQKSDMEDFTMPNASKQEYDIVTIMFCPMCGRRLEEV